MGVRTAMRHRCAIQRDTAAGTDDWGQKGDPDWGPHLADLPCYGWYASGREVTDGSKVVVVEDRRLIVPKGTDVTEADQVVSVTDRRGNTIFDGPMRIESVGRRRDHFELMLESV